MLRLALQAQLKLCGHDSHSDLKLDQSGLNTIGRVNVLLLKQLAAAAKISTHPGASTM